MPNSLTLKWGSVKGWNRTLFSFIDFSKIHVGYTRFGNRGGNASTNTSGEDLEECLWEIIREVYHSYF